MGMKSGRSTLPVLRGLLVWVAMWMGDDFRFYILSVCTCMLLSCLDLLFCLIAAKALERKRWCPFHCCSCSISDLSH